jgi:hypothetical protein
MGTVKLFPARRDLSSTLGRKSRVPVKGFESPTFHHILAHKISSFGWNGKINRVLCAKI